MPGWLASTTTFCWAGWIFSAWAALSSGIETVGRVKDEIARGDAANPAKVERWLRQLLEVAPDVGDLTLKWLANPGTGAATAVLAVAGRLQTRAE